uniref:Uncharacterized protein n=1 Tax=Calcidiscus leptoporus TaxID=127549 RepID=A0A7S0J3V6_9EUKA|mmetsp:Transcript_37652/g.88059  ORF Transcript_37652/g.88059 Transcript_37652/m.88059 type:complete len:235 (+) Transcript_37652:3-707(+)
MAHLWMICIVHAAAMLPQLATRRERRSVLALTEAGGKAEEKTAGVDSLTAPMVAAGAVGMLFNVTTATVSSGIQVARELDERYELGWTARAVLELGMEAVGRLAEQQGERRRAATAKREAAKGGSEAAGDSTLDELNDAATATNTKVEAAPRAAMVDLRRVARTLAAPSYVAAPAVTAAPADSAAHISAQAAVLLGGADAWRAVRDGRLGKRAFLRSRLGRVLRRGWRFWLPVD